MQKFKLTRKEFVNMAEAGCVFEFDENRYFFDETQNSPYRFKGIQMIDSVSIDSSWKHFNGQNEFTLVEPEPVLERRWIWLKDSISNIGVTNMSAYVSDSYAEHLEYVDKGFYKSEMYIDVEITG